MHPAAPTPIPASSASPEADPGLPAPASAGPDADSSTEPATDFPATETLDRDTPPEVLALIAGDLGEAEYRVDNPAESLSWLQRIAQAGTPVTLVALHTPAGAPPQVCAQWSAPLMAIDRANSSLLIPLSPEAELLEPGLCVRGSVRLQGVILTFEAQSHSCTLSPAAGQPPVLRLRLPHRLYRLQRRDSFRVPVPPSLGVFITLKPGFRHLENLKALDLSCGGASVLVRAPLEAVHQGKRFPAAALRLGPHATQDIFRVDMLVRHVRLAPASLSQMLGPAAQPARPAAMPTMPAASPRTEAAQAPARSPTHPIAHPLLQAAPPSRQAAMAAVSALLQPELLQLGLEFERMSTELERNLARLVNELGVSLLTRVRDDL